MLWFCVEGDSASGSARNGCDPNTQAFYLFRGVTANAIAMTLPEIMENKEFRGLVHVCKAGVGPTFDINKLYFNRINLLSDADIDGFGITCGMLSFFYRYMKPVILTGRLFKVFPPLYRLDSKDNQYVQNKSEMVEYYHERIVKTFKIRLENSSEFMTKSQMYDFIEDTYDYKEALIRAAKESGKINKFLVEIVIAYLTLYGKVKSENEYDDIESVFSNQKFITTIMNNIQKKFPEIVVDYTGRFHGVINGQINIIKVSPRFYKKTSLLIPVYQKYGYHIYVKEKDGTAIKMTIGEFLDVCSKLSAPIVRRYKGIGEFDGEELYRTTLNINNRVSIQYTLEDVERELAIFELCHGKSSKNMKERKEMMKKYKIKREDLDN